MVQRWPHVAPVGALGNQVPELHRIGRPALVHHKFNSQFLLLSCVVEMEKYRCFSGTTRENCCSLSTQNAKDKLQSGIVLSLPGGSFEPGTSAT
jgi:hypothetical protein